MVQAVPDLPDGEEEPQLSPEMQRAMERENTIHQQVAAPVIENYNQQYWQRRCVELSVALEAAQMELQVYRDTVGPPPKRPTDRRPAAKKTAPAKKTAAKKATTTRKR